MAADIRQTDSQQNKAVSTGLGSTAQRIVSWTSRGLLTAIVIVASLAFGRQVLHWWKAEPVSPSPSLAISPQPIGDPLSSGGPQALQFGDQSWTMRRQEVAGDSAQAQAALIAAARAAMPDYRLPSNPADAAEKKLLAQLEGQKPLAAEPGKWSVYAWNNEFPAMVGVLEANISPSESSQLELGKRRVVLWGMAMLVGARAWTIYLFEPMSGSRSAASAEVPLPPGAKLILAMGSSGSGRIEAFHWDGLQASASGLAKQFYEEWFPAHGWSAERPWQAEGDSWQAGYSKQKAALTGNSNMSADVRLGQDSGVIVLYDEKR